MNISNFANSSIIYGFCNKNGMEFHCPTRSGNFCNLKDDCAYKEPFQQFQADFMKDFIDKGKSYLADQQKEEPPKKIIIPCPVCKSVEIEEVLHHNGIMGPGGHSHVTHEVCKNCGVHLSPKRNVI